MTLSQRREPRSPAAPPAPGTRQGQLIAEAVAVWAFGASSLMKGLELDILLDRLQVTPT